MNIENFADDQVKDKILVVDDSQAMLQMMGDFLSGKGYDVTLKDNGNDAIQIIKETPFNVVVTDLKMEPVHGLEVVEATKRLSPDTEMIIITGYASLDSTLEAIRHHVFDYIEKPFKLEKIEFIIRNALIKNHLTIQNKKLLEQLNEQNVKLEKRVREVTKELEELSFRDGLTGLYNYRFFMKILNREVARAARYKHSLSLAMLDLDFFKHYNDCHGHQEGNTALVKLADVLQRSIREVDRVARYGGEEFAIILPETGSEKSLKIIDRIREEVGNLNLTFTHSGEASKLSISGGIASYPDDADNVDDLIKMADEALYKSKSTGRNRLTVSSLIQD